MKIHQDWDSPAFELEPVAENAGPFAGRSFLRALVARRAAPADRVMLVENGSALLPLQWLEGRLEFAGEADLCDYHTPLGESVDELVTELRVLHPEPWIFDSLPAEAAKVIVKGLAAAGETVEPRRHTAAMIIDLPGSFDGYLARLGRHERHELRRKLRRYHVALGPTQIESSIGGGEALLEFIRLHRLAVGAKGAFMTETIEALFMDLATQPGWKVDLLRSPAGDALAATFAYVDHSGYYLYNSGYDPAFRDLAPGMVLLTHLIEAAIAEGLPRFDFLKGEEGYKARLGGRPRPLFAVEVGK